MPRITPYEQQTSPGGSLGPGPTAEVSPLGATVSHIGDLLEQRQEENAHLDAAEKAIHARAARTQAFEDAKKASSEDGVGFTDVFRKRIQQDREPLLKSAKTRRARAWLTEALDQQDEEFIGQAMRFEHIKGVVHAAGTVDRTTSTGATVAFADPNQYEALKKPIDAMIAGMADEPELQATLTKRTRDQLSTAAVSGMIEQDSVGTTQELLKAQSSNAAIRDLAPEDRIRLLDSAQRKTLSDEAHSYTQQQRAEKEMQDAASKSGDQLLAQGGLTASWVERNRARLSADDYRYFYRALSGSGDAPSNPMIYADLRDRAGRGEDIRDEAREGLTNARISKSDYDRLVGEVEQERPGWYKRGSEFISTSAAVSQINPDPAAAQRKAIMLDDWNDWAKRNPQANDVEAQGAYKRIVDEYALVQATQFAIMKRAPRFMVGTRQAPDIDATEAATVKALRDGRIDRPEFDRQAALIKEWRDVTSKVPKPKAQPHGG